MSTLTKQCYTCKEHKQADEFNKKKQAKDGLHPSCKECKNAHERKHRDPGYSRKTNLKRSYGMSLSDYQRMFETQGGVCAICKQPERVVRRGRLINLSVDHCHKTGVVRGLLCSSCNRGIGKLKDSPAILKNALLYLLDYEVYVDEHENPVS